MLVLILYTYADHAEHVRPKLRTHAMLSPAKYPNVFVELISEMVSEQNPNACQMNKADVVFDLILIAHRNRSATSCSGVQPSIAACIAATTDHPAF
jgi:hypothetical protein